jgi:predicted ATPase
MGRWRVEHVGEHGRGEWTLVEAIAVAEGCNAEGGSKNFNFASRNLRNLRGLALARCA